MKINDARPVAFKYPTIGILLKIRYSLGKTLMCQINYFHIFLFSIYHYQSGFGSRKSLSPTLSIGEGAKLVLQLINKQEYLYPLSHGESWGETSIVTV